MVSARSCVICLRRGYGVAGFTIADIKRIRVRVVVLASLVFTVVLVMLLGQHTKHHKIDRRRDTDGLLLAPLPHLDSSIRTRLTSPSILPPLTNT
ncbi:hypothetical protein E2C01_016436 [Portunus trituberculatus]|uniref:Uncharacterized protein n=1 Tax=Portunus trituberculatus TaxID=210409 RepID=A0A5B7DP39_PORTR|nr:hypothetical protein [Portunus trituberculatus]